MRTLSLFAVLLLAASIAHGQTPPPTPRALKPLATSAPADLLALTIKLQKSGDTVKDAAATAMEVHLCVGAFSHQELHSTRLQITELAPLEDDTGKLLSTPQRLETILAVKDNVVRLQPRPDGLAGALATLVVETPARQATKIKSIAGKAVLRHRRTHMLPFKSHTAAELSGKPLEHEKLKGLTITPTLELRDGNTFLTLAQPQDQRDQRVQKVLSFGLLDDADKPNLRQGAFTSRWSEGVQKQTRTYLGDQRAKTYLYLSIGEDDEPQTVAFEFKDVELP